MPAGERWIDLSRLESSAISRFTRTPSTVTEQEPTSCEEDDGIQQYGDDQASLFVRWPKIPDRADHFSGVTFEHPITSKPPRCEVSIFFRNGSMVEHQ